MEKKNLHLTKVKSELYRTLSFDGLTQRKKDVSIDASALLVPVSATRATLVDWHYLCR
jgi:hypothetical protein